MAIQKKTTKRTITPKKVKKNNENVGFWRTAISLTALGTLWRTAIFTALVFALVCMGLAQGITAWQISGNSPYNDSYLFTSALQGIIFGGLFFAVYDAIYVAIARRYWISRTMDRIVLVGLELLLAGLILLQTAFVVGSNGNYPLLMDDSVAVWLLVVLAVLPPARAFAGVSYIVATRGIKSVK